MASWTGGKGAGSKPSLSRNSNEAKNNSSSGSGGGSGKSQSAPAGGTSRYDAQRGGIVTSDGKFYPTSNKDFIPAGYTATDQDLKTQYLNQPANSYVKNDKGELVPVGQKETKPGIYGPGQNPVIVTEGKYNTAKGVKALNTNNQSYYDPGYSDRQRQIQAQEAMRQANTGKANYQDQNGKIYNVQYQQPQDSAIRTIKAIDEAGKGSYTGKPANTEFKPTTQPNALQNTAASLYDKSYNAGEAFQAAQTPRQQIIPAVKQAVYSYASLIVGTAGNLEYKGKEFLIGAGTGAVFEAVTIAAERQFGNVAKKAMPVVGTALSLTYIGTKTNQFISGSPSPQASFPNDQTSNNAAFERGKATFEYTSDFTAGAAAELGGFYTGAKAVKVAASPADIQFMDLNAKGEQVPTRVEYRPGNFRTEEPVVSVTRGNPIKDTSMIDATNSAEPYQGFLDRQGEVGGRSAKQRANRISKPEQRQRKGPAANQLKYEVTTTPQEQTAELRGKGRFDQSVSRIESVRFERQPTVTVRTSNNPEQFQGLQITRTNEFQPVAARIVARGEPATRIRPANEPAAPTEIYRPSQSSMNRRGKTPFFPGSKEAPAVRIVEAPSRQVTTTITENVGKTELKTGTITSNGFQATNQIQASSSRQSFSPRSRLTQEIPGSRPATQEEFQAIRQGRNPPGYGSSDYRTAHAMDRLRAAREALRAGRVPATQGPRDTATFNPGTTNAPSRVTGPSTHSSPGSNAYGSTQVPRIGAAIRQTELQATATDQSLRFASAISQDQRHKQIQINSQAQAQDQTQIQVQALDQSQEQTQIQAQAQEQILDTRQRSRQRTTSATTFTEPTPRPAPQPPETPVFKERITERTTIKPRTPPTPKPEEPSIFAAIPKWNNERGQELFDVQVKRFGKFYRVNTQGLSIKDAVKIGSFSADTTAAASFKITPVGSSQPISGSARQTADGLISERFRLSKRDTNVFVEKNTYRINTAGEKSEIRPKGPFTKSSKKTGGKTLWE